MITKTNSEKVRLVEKFGYGFGDAASCLFFQTFSLYLAYFYTDVYGISAAAAATMFAVTRTWDNAFDPLMGVIADRTTTRWGKFRPYLIWIPIPLAIVAVLTFTTPDFGPTGKLVYAYITYGLLMMLYSAVNVPYAALLGVLTPHPEERTKLSSYRMMGAFVGASIVSYSIYALASYFSVEGSRLVDVFQGAVTEMTRAFRTDTTAAVASIQSSSITPDGFRSTIIVFAVMAVILFFATFLLTKERVVPIKAPPNSSWKTDVMELLKNGPWLILVAATILMNSFAGVRGGMIVYYFRYFVHNEALSAMYLMVGALASIAGIYSVQFITPYFGKKIPYIIFISLSGLFSALSYWVEPTAYTALFVYQVLINLFMGPPVAMIWSLYADAADYSEFKTGRRTTGLIFSASGMCQKLGWTIATSIGLYLLAFYRFQPNVEQAPTTLNGIRMLVSVFPALCCFGGALLMCFYPLNRRRLLEIEQVLQANREKAAAAVIG